MNVYIRILAILALFTPVLDGIAAEPPIPRFDAAQLTDEQVAACTAFKAKAGQLRKDEFVRILTLNVFPTFPEIKVPKGFNADLENPSFFMTRDDISDLLGKSGSSSDKTISYRLGEEGVNIDFAIIFFRDGYFAGATIGHSN